GGMPKRGRSASESDPNGPRCRYRREHRLGKRVEQRKLGYLGRLDQLDGNHIDRLIDYLRCDPGRRTPGTCLPDLRRPLVRGRLPLRAAPRRAELRTAAGRDGLRLAASGDLRPASGSGAFSETAIRARAPRGYRGLSVLEALSALSLPAPLPVG